MISQFSVGVLRCYRTLCEHFSKEQWNSSFRIWKVVALNAHMFNDLKIICFSFLSHRWWRLCFIVRCQAGQFSDHNLQHKCVRNEEKARMNCKVAKKKKLKKILESCLFCPFYKNWFITTQKGKKKKESNQRSRSSRWVFT